MNKATKLFSIVAVLMMMGTALICVEGEQFCSATDTDAPLVESNKTIVLDGNKTYDEVKDELIALGQKDPESAWDTSTTPATYHMSGINFKTTGATAIKIVNGLTIDVVGKNTITADYSGDYEINQSVLQMFDADCTIHSEDPSSVLNIRSCGKTPLDGIGGDQAGTLSIYQTTVNVEISDFDFVITTLAPEIHGISVADSVFGNVGEDIKTEINVIMGGCNVTSKDSSGYNFTTFGIVCGTLSIIGDTTVYSKSSDIHVDVKFNESVFVCITRGVNVASIKMAASDSGIKPSLFTYSGNIDFTTSQTEYTVNAESSGLRLEMGPDATNANIRAESGSVHGNGDYCISNGIWINDNCSFKNSSIVVKSSFVNNEKEDALERSSGFYCNYEMGLCATIVDAEAVGCEHADSTFAIYASSIVITSGSTPTFLTAKAVQTTKSCAIYVAGSLGVKNSTDLYIRCEGATAVQSFKAFTKYLEGIIDANGKLIVKDKTGKIIDSTTASDAENSSYVSTVPETPKGSVPFVTVTDGYGFTEYMGKGAPVSIKDCVTPIHDSSWMPSGKVFAGWKVYDDYGNVKTIPTDNTSVFGSSSNGSELREDSPIHIEIILGDQSDNSFVMSIVILVVAVAAIIAVLYFVFSSRDY